MSTNGILLVFFNPYKTCTMKLSPDQKRLAKSGLALILAFPVVYPLIGWIRNGAFSWDDVFQGFLSSLCIGFLYLLLVIGSHVPKKKE